MIKFQHYTIWIHKKCLELIVDVNHYKSFKYYIEEWFFFKKSWYDMIYSKGN
jgi:penicillin-binding protein-related factor A (putative recombinase)